MSSLTERLANFGFEPTQRSPDPQDAFSLEQRLSAPLSPTKGGPNFRKQESTAVDEPVPSATDSAGEPGVAVIVRCRPALSQKRPTFGLAADGGRDKVSLKLQLDEGEACRSRHGVSRLFRCNKYCGPTASQQDIFEATVPIVERTLEGCSGTIFCYGVTGSGKTYTMAGPPEDIGSAEQDEDSAGIVQRVAHRIFEYIRDRSSQNEVYSVEASFLEIYSSDGSREQLIDLLSSEDKQLDVTQDPLNPHAFVCDGLRRVGIQSPKEMCDVLKEGQQRLTFMETSANRHSSRSHCVFMLTVECLVENSGTGEPVVHRGKLMFVDLAGSESIKKVQALNNENEDLRQKQAIGINRVLSSLATMVTNMNRGMSCGHRDSALTMLLRDCLGGNARALLIATIGPELDGLEETTKTLTFAQQMMSIRNTANVNRIEQDQSILMKMRQRHSDCIRILQEKTSEAKDEESEEIKNLKQEMNDLNNKLLTKESVEKTLEEMRSEHLKNIDEVREEMAQTIAKELDKIRSRSIQDLETLRQSVEKHVVHIDDPQQCRHAEEHETRLGKIHAELQDAARSQRAIEEEAADFRVRLASAEERSKMLQLRQEEARKERASFDEERKALRHQGDQHWQKLTSVEGDTQRHKAEAEVQRAEVARLNAGRAEAADQAHTEREAWRAHEMAMQNDVSELHRKLEDAKRAAEVQAFRMETERGEACSRLRVKIERLEVEASTQAEQLSSGRLLLAQLEVDRDEAKQREEELRLQGSFELKQCQDEFVEATGKEKELMQMLHEIQEGIISASGCQTDLG